MSNQHGLTYQVDPTTGFLEETSVPNSLSAGKKKMFIELLKKNLGAAYRTCRELGMDYYSYLRHMKIDPVFKKEVKEAQLSLCESVEKVVVEKALEGKSPMWNIYYLNNNWPEKYGPRLRLLSDKSEDMKDVWGKVSAIDAEVVKSASIVQDNGITLALESKDVDSQR